MNECLKAAILSNKFEKFQGDLKRYYKERISTWKK